MAEISMDIIFDILCRLPVKTLLRLRCVSKQFQSLMDSPYFISCHLQYQTSKYPKFIIQNSDNPKPTLLDLDSVNNTPNFKYPFSVKRVDWICSSNGLLAISYYNENPPYYDNVRPRIILCNPSTKKVKLLPRCDSLAGGFAVGFCYDSGTDDYKLVTILRGQGFVYSLKADSWKKIEVSSKFYLRGSGKFVGNNTICWWNYDGNRSLVGYNVVENKFSELPLPNETGWTKSDIIKNKTQIIYLGGCLGLFSTLSLMSSSNVMSDKHKNEVWQMKEYGVKISWIKLYSEVVELPPWLISNFWVSDVFVHLENEDKFFTFVYGGLMLRYDLKTKKSTTLKINNFSPGMEYLWKIPHVESLVSPNVNE